VSSVENSSYSNIQKFDVTYPRLELKIASLIKSTNTESELNGIPASS